MQHFIWQQDERCRREGVGRWMVVPYHDGARTASSQLCPGPARSPVYLSRVFSLSFSFLKTRRILKAGTGKSPFTVLQETREIAAARSEWKEIRPSIGRKGSSSLLMGATSGRNIWELTWLGHHGATEMGPRAASAGRLSTWCPEFCSQGQVIMEAC